MTSFDRRLADWFEHRRWRVMAERDGEVTTSGVRISYRAGLFEIDPPGVYATPLGARGRKGVLIERTDGQGSERALQAAFGLTVLRRANAAFGTISGLPEEDG